MRNMNFDPLSCEEVTDTEFSKEETNLHREEMTASDKLTLTIRTSSGSSFHVNAERSLNVEDLKNLIAKRLNLPIKRFELVYHSRRVVTGTLHQNNFTTGSEVLVLLTMETGRRSLRNDNPTVFKIIEKLSDSQVCSFLNGATPLSVKLKYGEILAVVTIQISDSLTSCRGKSHIPYSLTTNRNGEEETQSNWLKKDPGVLESIPIQRPTTVPSKSCSSCSSSLARDTADQRRFIPQIDLGDTDLASRYLTEFVENAYKRENTSKAISSNAFIETISNGEDGTYNGTFSGTLLTPLSGKDLNHGPTRILALIQILRDLLLLSPHCHTMIQKCQQLDNASDQSAGPRKRSHASDQTQLITKVKSLKRISPDRRLRQAAKLCSVTGRSDSPTNADLQEHSTDNEQRLMSEKL